MGRAGGAAPALAVTVSRSPWGPGGAQVGPRVKLRTTDCPRPVLTLEEFSTGARQQRTTRPLVVSHGQLGVEGKKCLNLPGAEVEGRRRWGRVRTGAGGASRCRRGWTLGAAPGTPSSQRTGRGQGGAVCCPHLPPRPPRGDPHGCRGRSSVSSRVPREGGDCGPILPPPRFPLLHAKTAGAHGSGNNHRVCFRSALRQVCSSLLSGKR